MTIIQAVVHDRRIDVPAPSNLPDGTKVLLMIETPATEDSNQPTSNLNVEHDWDTSPEGIAAWLEWYKTVEPLKLTASEEADADAWLRSCEQYDENNGASAIEALG
jgi:hypothetical protein